MQNAECRPGDARAVRSWIGVCLLSDPEFKLENDPGRPLEDP